MKNISSVSLCTRLTLDLHSLNNEGTEGNQQQTRMVHIIDGEGKRAIVNGISGDMFKRMLVGHLVPLLEEAKQPLSEPARRYDPDRITADDKFLAAWKELKGKKSANSNLLSILLKSCSLTDLCGALFVDAALPRKSCVEFGWVVGLPSDTNDEPLTTTEQYFHVKYASEREGASGTDTTVGKQAIFHRPASSGVYALICNLDLWRIGLNDITREYVINSDERNARASALLTALAATLIKPTGAHRNTQNPHIVNCEGIISFSRATLPAPSISPLNHDYRDEMSRIAGILNEVQAEAISVERFETLAEGVRILTNAARQFQPIGVK